MIAAAKLPIPLTSQDDSSDDSSDSPRASWYSSDSLIVSRRSHRMSFPDRMCLTGLDADLAACAVPLLVRGRDLSIDGISFSHLRPVPYRHVQMLLPLASGLESIIVRLTWCRYSRQGEYVSGGYFVRRADASESPADDWDTLDDA